MCSNDLQESDRENRTMFFKLILWGAAIWLVVKALRSILVPQGGVRDTRKSKVRRKQKVAFHDVEDAEFEDIEEEP